ncbi:MAG: DUF4350 domain-containing protein [Ectothiorhodospiraceae bacterium]|nr:DUF4350 domain-containing protein [Ectothiorhodospiraceae bacterium]MCH8506250.1 DUF4350 domain-containing protein [Ectothiorhodospiraceae bacterium]
MKDRLLVLVGVLLTVLVLLMVFMPTPQERHSLPRSEDRGQYGLLALNRLLQHTKIPSHSHRQPYSRLAEALPSGVGNLLVVALPQRRAMEEGEPEALVAWVRRGNHVLFMMNSAMVQGSGDCGDDALARLLAPVSLRAQVVERGAPGGDEDPGLVSVPALDHALLREVDTLAAPALNLRCSLEVEPDDVGAPLIVRLARAGQAPTWWWVPMGQGGLVLTSHGGGMANAWLGEADNARLVLNVVGHSLGERGRVVFDDYHQGLTERYDTEAFFSDRRLHLTLLFVIGFWLFYAFGRNERLAPRQPDFSLPRAGNRVDASAGLYARRVRGDAVARGLIRHFHNQVRRLHGLPVNGEPAWDYLERNPRIDQQELRALRRMCDSPPRRSASLIRLSQQLYRVRNQIA